MCSLISIVVSVFLNVVRTLIKIKIIHIRDKGKHFNILLRRQRGAKSYSR